LKDGIWKRPQEESTMKVHQILAGGKQMPAKKIINDEQLLSLMHEGLNKKEAAKRLGVSPTAVGNRLKRLLPPTDSILEKYDLTDKEKAFALAKAQGLSNTRAAMSAYDVTSLQSAKSLGTTLMKNQDIKESIEEIMEAEGLTRRHRVKRLRLHVDSADPVVSLKGIDLANRMDGSYAPEKYQHSIESDLDAILQRIESRFMKEIDITPEENEPLSGV
jgi:DNA-binding Lrp family transcriptional regulator